MKKIIRCLLVDDDFDDREIFMKTLTEIGEHIRCRTAANGVEAINILEAENNEPPDFIFLDISMPKMNGIECLEHIRNTEHLNNCNVYMYSTSDETTIVEKSKALNAGFLVKPYSQSELFSMLDNILSS